MKILIFEDLLHTNIALFLQQQLTNCFESCKIDHFTKWHDFFELYSMGEVDLRSYDFIFLDEYLDDYDTFKLEGYGHNHEFTGVSFFRWVKQVHNIDTLRVFGISSDPVLQNYLDGRLCPKAYIINPVNINNFLEFVKKHSEINQELRFKIL